MPSLYCQQNPESSICAINPNYGAVNTFPTFPVYTTPNVVNPNTGGGIVPSVTITGGGSQMNNTTLDKILATITSMTALFQHAPYVPTNIQPSQGVDPNTLAALIGRGGVGAGNTYAGDGTASGKVETWIKNNTGVTLLAVSAVALYLMKPPTRK